MPVVGFNSVNDHNRIKIENLYGYYSNNNKKKKFIPRDYELNYICDYTSTIFKIKWGTLLSNLSRKRYFLGNHRLLKNKQDINKILCEYESGKSLTYLAKKNRSSLKTIKLILIENGILEENLKTRKCARYSKKEKEFLRINYPLYGIKYCADFLKRNEQAIRCIANKLKLKVIRKTYPLGYKKCWTCKHILELKYFYSHKAIINEGKCKECTKIYRKKYIAKKSKDFGWRKKYVLRSMLERAKKRAKERNLEFNLNYE